MIKAPLVFEPILKQVIWGGTTIPKFKGINSSKTDIGESWEVSAVSGKESVVAEGPYQGRNLSDLVEEFTDDILGAAVAEKSGKDFPLLIKLIDARDNLSVQVHPDDTLAKERHNSLGKTEMWYVISTEKGARIMSGLKRTISPEDYVRGVEDGSFIEMVASHESAPEDVYFIPAGQVHAIGAGNFLAEIQQSSDVTYRIFDYKRKDADGNERQLHTQEALEAIDFEGGNFYRKNVSDVAEPETLLAECKYFRVTRLLQTGETKKENNGDSFVIFICIAGRAEIICEEGRVNLTAGHSALIPASCGTIVIQGEATLLQVTA